MRRGLVVGKFLPLHRGHQFLIEAALAHVDELTVIVYDTPVDDPLAPLMPVEKRAQWVADLYPQAKNILIRPDPAPSRNYQEYDKPSHSQLYADDVAFLGPFTHVFTSDFYGDTYAQALGAELVSIDHDRELMPISGTQIRSDLYKHRAFVDPLVYRSLIQKVAFVGTESTGKSSLAAAMAEKYDTRWVHEYGRELWEEQDGAGKFEDLLKIGVTQHNREEAAALHSNRYLFCDTNAWTTMLWSQMYYGSQDARLLRLAQETKDDYIWFLCAADFAWVQDGFRELLGEAAELFQRRHVEVLDAWKIPYVLLYGDLESRIEQVSSALAEHARKRSRRPLAARV